MGLNIERITHSIKTAIACIIGFFCMQLLDLPGGQWVVITIIVVMCAQLYVGSVLQKAYLRFLGTLVGCILAASTIIALGSSHWTVAMTIGLASAGFSYIATGKEKLAYAGTLGAVTTAIIMLSPHPTILSALERFTEISLGLLIATLVSQFILPINARTHLRRSQAETLKRLLDYYVSAMNTHPDNKEMADFRQSDEDIVQTLLKQRQLAQESAREWLGSSFDAAHFSYSLICEKEMLRAISMMQSALKEVQRNDPGIITTNAFKTFNDAIIHSLNALIKYIDEDTPITNEIHLPTLVEMRAQLEQHFMGKPTEQLLYIHAFLFAIQRLEKSLTNLANLYKLPIHLDTL